MATLRARASIACIVLLASAASAPARQPTPAAPAQTIGAAELGADGIVRGDDGRIQVFVEMNEPAAAVAYAAALADTHVPRAVARQNAIAAGRAQAQANKSAQVELAQRLASLNTREVYRVALALNGISVMVAPTAIGQVAKLHDVKRVIPIYREFPTSAQSVPFIGAPNVWANTLGLPAGADGAGIRIGIIDTGTDYMHPDFGGPGAAAADYNNERAATGGFTTAGTIFPTAKVVGGTDFAGDAYTGANAPVPDANPMDCNGHGSHVSGTAAGLGMTAANATFTGPYDANPATYAPLAIAPGAAPKASIYALRVFGCAGSTGLTVNAINWALDPNGDLDLSDHLDVINMSLGSNLGSAGTATALASDNAAAAGMIVVASAGNAGDTFFIAGAPGVGSRVIATAASLDGGEPAVLVQVNSPAGVAGNYLGGGAAFGPAPSGQTANAVIAVDPTTPAASCGADPNDGCCALTNAAAIAGNVCVVNRGTCTFKAKAVNCQAAGAIAMIVVDNAPGSPPPGLGDDATIVTPITIPSERVTLADGAAIKNAITATPPVNVTLAGQNGADTLASFSSRGPRRILGSPGIRLKPDIAAPGLNITSVETGNVCTVAAGCTGVSDPSGTQVATRTLTISGTSMASPHMAGVMALLRELHPDWTVEELKALAMNYATHDVTEFGNATPPRYGPSRVGGGRVDPSQSAVGSVVAFNADDTGLVSVTFNPEVVGVVTQVKKVRVVNKGTTAQTFNLAFDNVVDSPGVSFSLPGGSSVSIPGGASALVDVQMSADSAQMDHTRDATLFPTQGVQANFGDQPRNFLTEEGAYLTFSQGGNLKLRVPVYMAEKPASTMSAPDTIVTGGAPTGSTTIPLSGSDVCTGTLAAGPTCTGTFPNDVESLVTPFELGVVSGLDPVNAPAYADIHYAGTAYFQAGGARSLTNDLVMFGVASWGDWSTPNEVAYDICVDNNSDGVYDRIVINTNPSIFVANSSQNDNFVRVIENTSTGGFTILGLGSFANLVSPATIDTALHDTNVMLLGATPSQLGYVSTAVTAMRYKIVTCPASNPGCARTTTGDRCSPAAGTFFDQAAGPFTYNFGAQGLNFGGDFLDEDLNGNALPVTFDTANMTANGSLGALLLHHHNKSGTRAEVVLLDTAQRADLALVQSVSTPTPAFGSNVTFTVTVSNNGPNNATGVVVSDPLPGGLTYVSDDGGGAYDASTGLWTVGALANAASATLHVVASVASTDQQCDTAIITGVSPLDPNPANDSAMVCVLGPRSSDLALAMSVSAPTVLVGAPLSYTITASNAGTDTAFSLNVAEQFPAYPALNPASFFASQGVYVPATGVWNIASLGKGGTATLTISLNAPNIAGALTDQADATSSENDPNTANNTASATTTVLSPATVTSTMTVAGSFIPGTNVTYTVTLANSAAYDQQNNPGSEFNLVLPASLTLVSASASSGTAVATVPSNTVDWNGVVPANGSITITIAGTINAGTAVGTVVSAQGAANSDADGNGTNEVAGLTDNPAVGGATDPTTFTVVSPAIASATKTVAGTFAPGGSVTYTVTVTNSGAATQLDNPGHEFTDVLPAALNLVSASASSGTAVATVATRTVTWDGSIAPGGSVTITISATIAAGTPPGPVSNQGSVAFDADGNGTNESSAQTDDPGVAGAADPTVFTVVSPAVVSATKSVSGNFTPGGDVVYTIVLHNTGAGAQLDNPGNELTDVLPAALVLVSASASSGAAVATVATRTVTWNGSIAAGGTVTITINARIALPGTSGPVTNQGTVSFDGDGNGTNESTALTDDPSVAGAANATTFQLQAPPTTVPALSPAMLVVLGFALYGLAANARRRAVQR